MHSAFTQTGTFINNGKDPSTVRATNVRFVRDMLYVALSDGREVGISLRRTLWLKWLARATQKQRKQWAIEPLGDAIYWKELGDGIEVCHLLYTQLVAI